MCYAWDRLEERDLVDVSSEDASSLLNLFSRVLTGGSLYLLHRGLDRGYLAIEEDLAGIRGKIDFSTTMKRQLIRNAKLNCQFDELSHDVVHNRILKTTVARLASSSDVDKTYRSDLADIHRRMSNIKETHLRADLFARVQLHRNNALYGFLMNVCEMVYNYYLASQREGDASFRDFFRDEDKMAIVFENFVCNFLRTELQGKYPGYRVKGAEYIDWDAQAMGSKAAALLPKMKTDISMVTPNGYLIIDTKYYRNAFTGQFNDKLHSSNLYQLFSYLRNTAAKGPEYENCGGMLLYPTVQKELCLRYEIQGHRVAVNTIDLSMDWRKIHDSLIGMVLAFGDFDCEAA
ncbi:5-methylcytosine-specific restriction system specificity protein McrC [Desulfosarcina alkanivorans]|uniref:5-methylcytosine-specific restriction system specificity protein McrC n=1 Tax=Desulfosarcina alkanivorans TaxID=571177 RepID=A0A5K7YCP4_9BACT|nr:5-methylcytosine-specific restriction system specificity protein McrC [Desulfosarcina alkanivorans]